MAVYQLLAKQSGKKVVLPRGIEAVISYENLIIRKCFRGVERTVAEIAQAQDVEMADSKRWMIEVSLKELGSKVEGQTFFLPTGEQLHFKRLALNSMTEAEREKLLIDARNSKNHYTKYFDCDTIKDTLCIRLAERNDYFVINEMGNRKKLSRYFIDIKLPVDKRNSVVVLTSGNEVLWLVGGRRCERFKIGENTRNILKVSYKGERQDGSD